MYTITIMDCLKAVQKAKEARFFNFDDFDYEEYEHYEKVQVSFELEVWLFFIFGKTLTLWNITLKLTVILTTFVKLQ